MANTETTGNIARRTSEVDSQLLLSVRQTIYRSLLGVREDQLDELWDATIVVTPIDQLDPGDQDTWRQLYERWSPTPLPGVEATASFPTQLTTISQRDVELNAVVMAIRSKFEQDRADQIRKFSAVVLVMVNAWIAACNELNFADMNQLGNEIVAYLEASARPKRLPLQTSLSGEDGFPGLVSPEATGFLARFNQVRVWMRDEGTMTRRVMPLTTIEEFLTLPQSAFLHR